MGRPGRQRPTYDLEALSATRPAFTLWQKWCGAQSGMRDKAAAQIAAHFGANAAQNIPNDPCWHRLCY